MVGEVAGMVGFLIPCVLEKAFAGEGESLCWAGLGATKDNFGGLGVSGQEGGLSIFFSSDFRAGRDIMTLWDFWLTIPIGSDGVLNGGFGGPK